MNRWTKWIWVAGLLSLALGSSACRKRVDPTAAETKELPEGRPCPPETATISDGESDNKTNYVEGRGGYWYTFLDIKEKGGSDIWPTAGALGGTFEMTEGGANGTKHAAHMKGTVGGAEIVYAGMGLGLEDPPGPYDASKYQGISFWAKKGAGSTPNVRLKVPDEQTHPDGKICKSCNNDFGTDLVLTDDWVQYTVPFRSMKQIKTWGDQFSDGIHSKTIYGVQFQVNEKGATFDVWVDEIQFTGCK